MEQEQRKKIKKNLWIFHYILIPVVGLIFLVFTLIHIFDVETAHIVDAPVLVQMEDFGYPETYVYQSTVRDFKYKLQEGKEYSLTLYVYPYDAELEGTRRNNVITVHIYDCEGIDPERYYKELMLSGYNTLKQFTSQCRDGCLDLNKKTVNNIEEAMFALNLNEWKVDKGYALYDIYSEKDTYPPNRLYLMKGKYILEFKSSERLVYNEEIIQTIVELFEKADEVFE